MRPLRYSINVTLDGCCDHRTIVPDEELHLRAMRKIAEADALIFGRTTYEMMEAAWRQSPPEPEASESTSASTATSTEAGEDAAAQGMPEWTRPFAVAIDAARKHVVSSTLERVDWNAELVRGDLATAVRELKRQPGGSLFTGGVMLPMRLAELGLIDEYEFVVHPVVVGHGPTLFAGISQRLDLRLVDRVEYASGAVAMTYAPRTAASA